jgi:ribosomal protein L29
MVDGADLTGTAAAAAGGAPKSSSAQDVQQLKQLLAEREAELAALRQQLQQLAPPA